MSHSAKSVPGERRSVRAFTLVEMLVVIGVIAILLGLLLTGLRAAMGSGNKTRELSALRQIFYGWSMYSNTNEEQILPGFIDINTQDLWNVEYRDQKKQELDPQYTQAWPWRLAPYVDYSWELLCGYRSDPEEELSAIPAAEVQSQPFFGYNAMYVGGWWTANAATGPAVLKFDDYVTRTAGSFARPDSMILFSGATERAPGDYKPNENDLLPGSHWVSPPNQAQTKIWQASLGGPNAIDVVAANAAVPLNRYGPSIAILTSDGGAQSATINELLDMRRWVSAADKRDWTHTE